MVYAGLINKNIVSALQANGCNAIGLSGADGNAIPAHSALDQILTMASPVMWMVLTST
jgi:acetylglutamate kinase